jgi:hypothetical protein
VHYHRTQIFDVPARDYARLEARSLWTQAKVSVWELFVFPPGRQLRGMVPTEHTLGPGMEAAPEMVSWVYVYVMVPYMWPWPGCVCMQWGREQRNLIAQNSIALAVTKGYIKNRAQIIEHTMTRRTVQILLFMI